MAAARIQPHSGSARRDASTRHCAGPLAREGSGRATGACGGGGAGRREGAPAGRPGPGAPPARCPATPRWSGTPAAGSPGTARSASSAPPRPWARPAGQGPPPAQTLRRHLRPGCRPVAATEHRLCTTAKALSVVDDAGLTSGTFVQQPARSAQSSPRYARVPGAWQSRAEELQQGCAQTRLGRGCPVPVREMTVSTKLRPEPRGS